MINDTDTNSLVLFTRASEMLAEANTIQKAKELKDLALTAADWAKRKDMGEAAIQHCRSYALEAERKMGEMLRETERAKANQYSKKGAELPYVTKQPAPTLAELGLTKRDSAEAQKLARLPRETFDEIKSGDRTRSGAVVPHVSHNSGENEWYTPPEYVEAARKVMGCINLDPASTEIANKIVGAERYFCIENNGLEQNWAGNVWMNPPYASELIKLFISKFSSHVGAGDIVQGIVLVNNATETVWFRELIDCASAVVFTTGRVKFLDPQGNPGAPLQGQAVIYFGENRELFVQEFRHFGWSAYL
jgi:phage N-6-adenine-methyltransferase